MRDVGTSVWRSGAVAAERHQPPDDSAFARPRVPHDDSPTSLAAAAFFQDVLQPREEPIPAHKRSLCCEAGDFKQQWLEHDVCLLEWHQSP